VYIYIFRNIYIHTHYTNTYIHPCIGGSVPYIDLVYGLEEDTSQEVGSDINEGSKLPPPQSVTPPATPTHAALRQIDEALRAALSGSGAGAGKGGGGGPRHAGGGAEARAFVQA
jgi:hypothetical protein